MNKKFVLVLSIIIILIMGFLIISDNKKQEVVSSDKIKVVTSFYPLYFFATEITKDRAIVSNVIPTGAGPHGYEPTARDITNIENSNLLILNGGDLEGWGENIKMNLKDKDTHIVIAGEGLMTIENKEESDEGHEENEEENGDHNYATDPHVWLSPILAIKMVGKIEAGLSLVDPNNSSFYKTNAEVLKNKLSLLDEDFKKGLSSCLSKDIVVSHSAFTYLAQAYNLNQISIAGLSPEEEPSPKDMIKIVEFAKINNVKYIFFESLASPKLSETIAREIGAKTLVLNPIGGLTIDEINEKKDYFSEMRNNLTNLKIALQCQ